MLHMIQHIEVDENHELTKLTEAVNFGIFHDFSDMLHFCIKIHKYLM